MQKIIIFILFASLLQSCHSDTSATLPCSKDMESVYFSDFTKYPEDSMLSKGAMFCLLDDSTQMEKRNILKNYLEELHDPNVKCYKDPDYENFLSVCFKKYYFDYEQMDPKEAIDAYVMTDSLIKKISVRESIAYGADWSKDSFNILSVYHVDYCPKKYLISLVGYLGYPYNCCLGLIIYDAQRKKTILYQLGPIPEEYPKSNFYYFRNAGNFYYLINNEDEPSPGTNLTPVGQYYTYLMTDFVQFDIKEMRPRIYDVDMYARIAPLGNTPAVDSLLSNIRIELSPDSLKKIILVMPNMDTRFDFDENGKLRKM